MYTVWRYLGRVIKTRGAYFIHTVTKPNNKKMDLEQILE